MLFVLAAIILTEELRVPAILNQPQEFCIGENLIDRQRYDVKVSFLGSIGIDMALFWKHNREFLEVIQSYSPMDTQKLRFVAPIEDKCFYVIGYQISKAIILPSTFEFIIKLEPVLIDDLNYTYALEYLLVIVIPLIIVWMIRRHDQKVKLH